MIKHYTYTSQLPWPHILFLGCIHGNEPAGKIAIQQWMQVLETVQLQNWAVTCVPICNPKAYQQWVRYIQKNLNRVIQKTTDPNWYEEMLANHLCPLIEDANYIIDLHTSHASTSPYAFQDYFLPEYAQLVEKTWIQIILQWWPTLYNNTHTHYTDTIEYARSYWIPWITVECGWHTDPNAVSTAYSVIHNVLVWFDMIANEKNTNTTRNIDKKYITMKQLYRKKWLWTLYFQNNDLTYVQRWTCIARYEHWETLIAPEDWYVILPYSDALVGEERFYFWTSSLWE